MSCSHLLNDPLFQQTLPLGSHDKVVGVVFVVDNILQINTWKERKKERPSGQADAMENQSRGRQKLDPARAETVFKAVTAVSLDWIAWKG